MHAALEHVDAHLDHDGDDVGAVGVGVMDHELAAVGLVVAVDLLISLKEEVLEDGGTEEGVGLAAPVVVMEHGGGMQAGAGTLGQLEFPIGEVLDQVVHLVLVLHVVHESVLHAAEVMSVLKDAGSDHGALEGLVAVDLRGHADAHLPQVLGKALDLGGMDVITPVLDVLDDDLVGGVHGEAAGHVLGEGVGDAPGGDHVRAALLGVLGSEAVGMHHESHRFVLVDVAVGLAVDDALTHVFFRSEHLVSSSK